MPVSHLVVQWPRLGPYHLARLHATHRHAEASGIRLTALETASVDHTYAWREEAGAVPFERVQVFPGETYEHIDPRRMEREVTRTLDRLQPDAVAIHTYSFPDSRACLAWCRRHRRVAIVMTDSKLDDAPRSWWREAIKGILVRGFDASLAAGTPQREYLASHGFPKDLVFPGYDVVDNAYFRDRAEAARSQPDTWRHLPGLEDPEPFFLASSRFIGRKNLPRLLSAYAAYRSGAATPWRLVLLGDGPDRDALQRQVEEHRIEGVTLTGFRQIEEIPAYYAFAGAFVHAAIADQWALVVNEAMATGLPVIVSRGAGCAHDLVEHGANGFTFDPGDTAELARLLALVADDTTDRAAMRQRSLEIIARWSPDLFADSLLRAAAAGSARAERREPIALRTVLTALRHAARTVHSFHSIEA